MGNLMRQRLDEAGLDTAHAHLNETAIEALKANRKDFAAAVRALVRAVSNDAELLASLFNLGPDAIAERAAIFLRQRQIDLQGPPQLAASGAGSRQQSVDAKGTSNGNGSKTCLANGSKISRRAAAAVAQMSVFDQRIVATLDIRWGDLTQREFIALRAGNRFRDAVEQELARIKWPDLDTPLRRFASRALVERIAKRAERVRQMAIDEAHLAVASVRELGHEN